jgi:hypothetical protein
MQMIEDNPSPACQEAVQLGRMGSPAGDLISVRGIRTESKNNIDLIENVWYKVGTT